MDKIDRIIFQCMDTLANGIRTTHSINTKRYNRCLFMIGVIGAFVWLQHQKIQELQDQLIHVRDDICELYNYSTNPEEEVTSDE